MHIHRDAGWFLTKGRRIGPLGLVFTVAVLLISGSVSGAACVGRSGAAAGRTSAKSDLLVWYDFEGDFLHSGTVVDRSGHGNDAQVVGDVGSMQGLRSAQAVSFSADGYLQAAGNPAAGKTSVSFALWFQTDDPTQNYKLASAAWWQGGPASGWVLATHAPEFWSDDTSSLYLPDFVNEDNHFIPGEWTYEVLTYDGVRIKEYTDGLMVNDWPTTGAPIGEGVPMIIGAWLPYTAYNFAGAIDDFKIYDRCLSKNEIQAMYSAENSMFYLPWIGIQ